MILPSSSESSSSRQLTLEMNGATTLPVVGYLFTGRHCVTSHKTRVFSSAAISTTKIVISYSRIGSLPVNECELDNFSLNLSRFKLQMSLFWDIWYAVSDFFIRWSLRIPVLGAPHTYSESEKKNTTMRQAITPHERTDSHFKIFGDREKLRGPQVFHYNVSTSTGKDYTRDLLCYLQSAEGIL